MNRPTEPDEILAMPDAERDAYAAEVCMGYKTFSDGAIGYLAKSFDIDGYYTFIKVDYEPSQPTEKGKAQCWDLMMKYKIGVVGGSDGIVCTAVENINSTRTQTAVVTAAILCVLAEKE